MSDILLENRVSEVEKGFSELKDSVLELAKRQNTIMAALLIVADKLDIPVEEDDD